MKKEMLCSVTDILCMIAKVAVAKWLWNLVGVMYFHLPHVSNFGHMWLLVWLCGALANHPTTTKGTVVTNALYKRYCE